jgi:hypothetical protein
VHRIGDDRRGAQLLHEQHAMSSGMFGFISAGMAPKRLSAMKFRKQSAAEPT